MLQHVNKKTVIVVSVTILATSEVYRIILAHASMNRTKSLGSCGVCLQATIRPLPTLDTNTLTALRLPVNTGRGSMLSTQPSMAIPTKQQC